MAAGLGRIRWKLAVGKAPDGVVKAIASRSESGR